MTIIDIHSHLLPKVDDGKLSRWSFPSMMARYRDAGISNLVFTPHVDDPYVDTRKDRIPAVFGSTVPLDTSLLRVHGRTECFLIAIAFPLGLSG